MAERNKTRLESAIFLLFRGVERVSGWMRWRRGWYIRDTGFNDDEAALVARL